MTTKFTQHVNVRNYSLTAQTGSPGDHFKSQRATYFENHTKVLNHIKDGKGVSKDLINEVLFVKPIVTDDHIALCDKLFSGAVTVTLPYANTSHSTHFTTLAGSADASRSELGKVPGCYYIFDKSSGRGYIGHTVHLGKRVREHTNGSLPVTSLQGWVSEMRQNDSGLVSLYRIPVQDNFNGLSQVEFLCVLEMYLFLVHAPTENRTLVATPGVMQSPQANSKHAAKMNKILYVYKLEDNGELTYLYTSPSSRGFCRDLGVSKSFISSVMARTDGWFRETILFTYDDLLPGQVPSMTMEQLQQLHSDLKDTKAFKSRPQLVVTNTETGEVTLFPTRAHMERAIGPQVPPFSKYKVDRK